MGTILYACASVNIKVLVLWSGDACYRLVCTFRPPSYSLFGWEMGAAPTPLLVCTIPALISINNARNWEEYKSLISEKHIESDGHTSKMHSSQVMGSTEAETALRNKHKIHLVGPWKLTSEWTKQAMSFHHNGGKIEVIVLLQSYEVVEENRFVCPPVCRAYTWNSLMHKPIVSSICFAFLVVAGCSNSHRQWTCMWPFPAE